MAPPISSLYFLAVRLYQFIQIVPNPVRLKTLLVQMWWQGVGGGRGGGGGGGSMVIAWLSDGFVAGLSAIWRGTVWTPLSDPANMCVLHYALIKNQ